jgi:hypothetical protein
VFVRGPAMDTRRSFYLASRQDDFAEPAAADARRADFSDIPMPNPRTITCGPKIDYPPAAAACFVV